MGSRHLGGLLLVASLALAGQASAEPTAADKDTARGLMNEGRAHRDKGDLPGALKSFAGADALMHVPTTGLELARAQTAVGQLVEARDTALRVMRLPEKPDDPPPFKAARSAASALNDELQGRIPSLTVNVKNVPEGVSPTLSIDDADVPVEVLGHPRKLDPGHHVIVAKAGTSEGKQEVDLAEKETKEVTVELPAQTAAGATTGGAATSPSSEGGSETPRPGGSKVLIFGGLGLAGAGVIAGSITGLVAISKASSIKGSSSCQSGGTVCNPSVDGDLSSGRTMATISTVSFVAAGVGAAVGVIALLVGGGSSSSPAPTEAPAAPAEDKSARLVPWLGLGAAGLSGTF